MHRAMLLCVSFSVILLAACGGSRNDAGLTNPDTPAPTGSIAGTVALKGAPLAGVSITLWSTNTNAVLSTATTDASGNYNFSGIKTTGNVPLELHIWASKSGYGFYPSVSSGAKVTRADHTGQFEPGTTLGVPMYLIVIDYKALPNTSVIGANFTAFDGSNPLVAPPPTGQTISFAPGDDGALKKGIPWLPSRFVDNQDGTVSDTATGLVWLRDAGCLPPAQWSAAVAEVNQLASGACGLNDGSRAGQWRMPNVVEMESVIDASASNPALPTGAFVNISSPIYWTSTSYFGGQQGSPNAWAVRMIDGSYVNDSILNAKSGAINGVWAVKGAGAGPGKLQATGLFNTFTSGDDGALQMGTGLMYPRFIDHGDGTFTDALTGLVWLKKADCIQGDWASSLRQVNALASGQCGLTDGSASGAWRMPNRNELLSLADRNQNNEADYFDFTFLNSDKSVFQYAIFSNFARYHYYWTSTTSAADPGNAWSVYSCDFGLYGTSKSSVHYTLAVR